MVLEPVVQPLDPVIAEQSCIGGIDSNFLHRHKIQLLVQSPSPADCVHFNCQPQSLGQVTSTSGFRLDCTSPTQPRCNDSTCSKSHCKLDWAIVELSTGAFSTNKAPPKSLLFGDEGKEYHCDDFTVITKFADPKVDSKVHKAGRTTAATTALTLGSKTCLSEMIFGNNVHGLFTEEWQVRPLDFDLSLPFPGMVIVC